MNHSFLEKSFGKDNRAVLLYPISDYKNGLMLEVATTVKVVDMMIDPHMPSGYSAVVHIDNANRDYIVDKDILMPYEDFKKVYNKVLKMALRDGLK